jgi:ABC-type dipeptide/oligopeptide/nickel transport system ATPase component
MSLVSVEHLSVTYVSRGEQTRAVDGVSFTIEAGEILALVGESGSGKSSVALALTRLLPTPPAVVCGRVMFGQNDLLEVSESTLRMIRGGKVSYVFQDPASSLNPVLTVGEQLVESIERHTSARGAQARREAAEWLKRVGIAQAEERLRAYPHEFSGGMQQRACLAMALAARPSLLIADEPTTALDVTIQVQMLRLLRDLQRSLNLSILLISHDLMVVERLAHRVGVMTNGKLVEVGPVAQVLTRPAHPSTEHLLRVRASMALRRKPQHG